MSPCVDVYIKKNQKSPENTLKNAKKQQPTVLQTKKYWIPKYKLSGGLDFTFSLPGGQGGSHLFSLSGTPLLSPRRVVENAFDIMALRFRGFHRPRIRPRNADVIVKVALVLHKFFMEGSWCPNLWQTNRWLRGYCKVSLHPGKWRNDTEEESSTCCALSRSIIRESQWTKKPLDYFQVILMISRKKWIS